MENVDRDLAAALGRVSSGLYIMTLRRGEIETGMLASWVQQCSFQPPQVSVAVRNDREIVRLLEPGTPFCLNVLEDGQTGMIAHFGRGFSLRDDAFQNLDVDREGPGGPILKESLAWMECVVSNSVSAGDHDLIIAQVMSGKVQSEGQPMTHARKNGMHY